MIRIGIYGYGNLGRGVELAASQNGDIELVSIFTRRVPSTVTSATGAKVRHITEAALLENEIDVMILCGGSATDLPVQTPELAKLFNTVDSFDTHARIPEHFANVDAIAKEYGHLSLISAGWDPGLFSIMRMYANAVLPSGKDYTFWGRGVSQGHSDAIRRIEGVLDARQYTVPVQAAADAVRSGQCPELATGDKHLRECYVVAEKGADLKRIENEIKTMPNYFSDYTTTVTFITQEEMDKEHSALPHGGFVIRNGQTGGGCRHTVEFSLKLESNPEFTGSVLVACARAVYRMHARGDRGCMTLFDVPPAMLIRADGEELRSTLL